MANLSEQQISLLKAVEFGDEVDQFLKGRVGQYMLQCAEVEIEEAVKLLKSADAEDPKSIRELQNKVKVAESIQTWLIEAVQAGLKAESVLKGDEDAPY